jgi:NADPH2:quinone reductase
MRAVWYDRQGAADEVLTCGELPTPEAGHGEVRVRLEASGVNPSDTYRRRGPPAMEYPRVVTTVTEPESSTRSAPACPSIG